MSDYYEYYHKNPHELSPLSDKEEEEMFEEAMYDKIESMEPWEYLDWGSGDEKYDINPVASFKGIQVWSCNNVPNARIQREIDKEVSKVSAERLTVFYDDYYQNWRWPMSREASGKGTVRLVNHQHIKGEQTLSLLQRLKLISIPVSAVEPSMVEMLLRLRQAFDAEHVTKKFYKEFKLIKIVFLIK